jgi:hypothetical protein
MLLVETLGLSNAVSNLVKVTSNFAVRKESSRARQVKHREIVHGHFVNTADRTEFVT